jgi:hypothetical protein
MWQWAIYVALWWQTRKHVKRTFSNSEAWFE